MFITYRTWYWRRPGQQSTTNATTQVSTRALVDNEGSGPYVVVISINNLVGPGELLVLGASVFDIVRDSESVGQLMEGDTTTKVTGVDGVTGAECSRRAQTVEEFAVVDIRARVAGIGCDATAAKFSGVRLASHEPRGRILGCDGFEVGSNV